MTLLPSGTVTFLFTDIEGSTRLAQAHPATWEEARAQHHALLRRACEAHGGFVFQIVGDQFCVAFATAADALSAAIEAQRDLHEAQTQAQAVPTESAPPTRPVIKVRMGLHTGAADWRDGEYAGYLTLVRVQRVMSAASGEQILLSQATADLAKENLPAGVNVRDLGEHSLKGLSKPERLWQVDAANLPHDFPPSPSIEGIANNLPVQLTSFIGRRQEISEIARRLNEQRLVTLTGAGGTGKTRLSLEVASKVMPDFPDGVWLVELAPLTDASYLPDAVASALRISEQYGRSTFNTLGAHLRRHRALLLLDNCEHLVAECARLADELLHTAPLLRILATSRESLGIAGEVVYRVPSLPTPPAGAASQLDELTHFDSVQLFVDRARAANSGFVVTAANAPAIADICSQLDGIPLAIELAAARVKVFPPDQIAARLGDRFRLLTGGSRTALPRQQTLRGTIEWSHGLLAAPERAAFRRLAVFVGGWTFEAAELVCAGAPLDASDILDNLTRLIEKSLVSAEDQDHVARYRMLETIRQYAYERLAASGELEATRDKHLSYCLRLAREAKPFLSGPTQAEWLNRLEAERDNLRAAFDYAGTSGQITTALQLTSTLGQYWFLQAIFNQELSQLERLLANPEAQTPTLDRALALIVAASLLITAVGEIARGEAYAAEALSITQNQPDALIRSEALLYLGIAAASKGDNHQAEMLLLDSEKLAQHLGQPVLRANALGYLGCVRHILGDYAHARTFLEESLRLTESVGHGNLRAWALRQLSYVALREHDLARAYRQVMQSVEQNFRMNSRAGLVNCLAALAGVFAERGLLSVAGTLCGVVSAQLDSLHTYLYFLERFEYEKTLALLRAGLEPTALDEALAAGRLLTSEEAVNMCAEHAND